MRRLSVPALALALALAACGGGGRIDPPELARHAEQWPAPNRDLRSTRSVEDSAIDASTVSRLAVAWRYRLPQRGVPYGAITSNPIVAGDSVYLQDMLSDVYALDRETGAPRWRRRFDAGTLGPNGVSVGYGLVFGNTDTTAFALDAATGDVRWRRRLLTPVEQYVDIAPVVANGLVYTSTVGFPPGGKGALYGLDAHTGAVRWKFVTVRGEWARPDVAGGGGAWNPVAVDEDGRVYAGIANPGPAGGTPELPNGTAFGGDARYTDSLVVLDGETGELLWHDQVVPSDVRDYDFHISPVLTDERVFGAGKSGHVIAWDRSSRRRVWEQRVGVRQNDEGPLPREPVRVCPGLFGGVETPMAHAGDRLFVAVVDLCVRGSRTGFDDVGDVDASTGRGQLVALDAENGRRVWRRAFDQPLFACATAVGDLVVTGTYDGVVHALTADAGRPVWRAELRAGLNACPAVDRDLLVVAAGAPHPRHPDPVYEVVAFRLR